MCFFKIQDWCASTDTKNVKRQPPERMKTSSNHASDKGFASEIYKEFSHLTVKRQLNFKTSTGYEQTFLQGRFTNGQMAEEPRERCSTPSGTREMEIEGTRLPTSHLQGQPQQRDTRGHALVRTRTRREPRPLQGECQPASPSGQPSGSPSKGKHRATPAASRHSAPGCEPERNEDVHPPRHAHMNIHSSTIPRPQKVEMTPDVL